MQNEILGRVVFASQYALETSAGRETWADAINRVEAMHQRRFKGFDISDKITRAFDLVRDQRCVPSQRSVQFGGVAIEKNNMRIYNCTYSPCDRPRFFSELFWLLLSGCGTGFSVRSDDVYRLPNLIHALEWARRPEQVYKIKDSIEGWAAAAQDLLNSYFMSGHYSPDHDVIFDYSEIRPKGSRISSGGHAPGPGPLKKALNAIKSHLDTIIEAGQRRLEPLDCFQICMYLSEAVINGGRRRSASIALCDEACKVATCKTGDWFKDHPEYSYANISVSLPLDASRTSVNEALASAQQWGEPGIYFTSSQMHGTNPCAEIGLFPYLVTDLNGVVTSVTQRMLDRRETYQRHKIIDYVSGWQACNLTEVNAAHPKNMSKKGFIEAVRAAAFIGTLQASYTDQGYLMSISKYILEHEALIGVSMTGMAANPLAFDVSFLTQAADHVQRVNSHTAEKIGINWASRQTCIKPSGNTSTLLGCSSGIHPYHAKRYIRRIRLSLLNPVFQHLNEYQPFACEIIDEHTGVVSFACSAPDGALTRETDSALEHLERVRLVQRHWVNPASKMSRVQNLAHSVSNTCTVKPDEWESVSEYLFRNKQDLRGVAFLGYFDDSAYDYAPYQTVIAGEKSEKIWQMLAGLDWSHIDLDSISGAGEDPQNIAACSGDKCAINLQS